MDTAVSKTTLKRLFVPLFAISGTKPREKRSTKRFSVWLCGFLWRAVRAPAIAGWGYGGLPPFRGVRGGLPRKIVVNCISKMLIYKS